MSERAWLVREAVRRILSDAPAPPATWPSVARRVVVVLAFFAFGIVSGNLSWAILACFGAVQIGLVEAALPFRGFVRLVVPLVLLCGASVAVAMVVADSWIGVVVISALAYVFGCTAGLSPRAMTIGISCMALAVIFAGTARPMSQIPESVAWVCLGMFTQALLWLVLWRPERRWFVRRSIANKLRAIVLMLRGDTVTPEALVRMHNQSDVAVADIRSAAFPPDEEARMMGAYAASILVARAVTSWMVIDQPGDDLRIRVGLRIAEQAKRLDGFLGKRATRLPAEGTERAEIADALGALERAIDAVLNRTTPPAALVTPPAEPPRTHTPVWKALAPGSRTSRDGLRMVLGVGLAEALTVLYSGAHSFWLPLTVVFVLRPSWSLTVIRGVNRTIGNLGALLLLPFLFISLGPDTWGLMAVLAVLAAITYRWFFGNYVIASFGLAGTILLLDFALNPNPELFVTRFVATILGSAVALVAILAIPGWKRDVAPEQARALISSVRHWRDDVLTMARQPTREGVEALDAELREARRHLLTLEPTAVGVLLEPGSRGKPVPLAMLFSTGSREVAALMAVSYCLLAAQHHEIHLSEQERGRILTRANVTGAGDDFDRAARAYLA